MKDDKLKESLAAWPVEWGEPEITYSARGIDLTSPDVELTAFDKGVWVAHRPGRDPIETATFTNAASAVAELIALCPDLTKPADTELATLRARVAELEAQIKWAADMTRRVRENRAADLAKHGDTYFHCRPREWQGPYGKSITQIVAANVEDAVKKCARMVNEDGPIRVRVYADAEGREKLSEWVVSVTTSFTILRGES